MLQGLAAIMTSRKAGLDADAQAFINATQISDSAIQGYINTLVKAAKANGWWDSCIAIYPMVGDGVNQTYASQHKYNLKDPQDTDAAFRLSFAGGWSHSATGASPGGVNGYANSHIIPSADLSLNDTHASYYSRENTAFGSEYSWGAFNGATQEFGLIIRRSGGTYYSIIYDETVSLITGTLGDGSGYFLNSRLDSTTHDYYRNGSSFASSSVANGGSLPSIALYLAGLNNNGGEQSFSDKECAFATVGIGVDSTMAADMYTDIQAFNTSLGRQV